MDQPRTGQASIRETVNTFGMVYIFSRTGVVVAEPLASSAFLSDRLTRELVRVLLTVVKTLLRLALNRSEVAYSAGWETRQREAKARSQRGRARK